MWHPIDAAGASVSAHGVISRIADIRASAAGLHLLYTVTTRRPDIRRIAVHGGTNYPRDPAAIQVDVVVTTVEQPETRIPAHIQTTWSGTDETGLYTSETELWIRQSVGNGALSATDELVITAGAPDLPHLVVRIPWDLINDAVHNRPDVTASTDDDFRQQRGVRRAR